MVEAASEYVITSAGARECDQGSLEITDATSCRAAADALSISGLYYDSDMSSPDDPHGCHSEYGNVRYNSFAHHYMNGHPLAHRKVHCRLICKQAVLATPAAELTAIEAIDGYTFIGVGHCCRGAKGMGTGLTPYGCKRLCDMSTQCRSFTHSRPKGACKVCATCRYIPTHRDSWNQYYSWTKIAAEKASWSEVAKPKGGNKAKPAGKNRAGAAVSHLSPRSSSSSSASSASSSASAPSDPVPADDGSFFKEMHSIGKVEEAAVSYQVPAQSYEVVEGSHIPQKGKSAVNQVRILQKHQAKTAVSDQVPADDSLFFNPIHSQDWRLQGKTVRPAGKDTAKPAVSVQVVPEVEHEAELADDKSEPVEQKPAKSEELEPEAASEQQAEERKKDSKSVRSLPLLTALLVTAAIAL